MSAPRILLNGSKGRMGQVITATAAEFGVPISAALDVGDKPADHIAGCDVIIDFTGTTALAVGVLMIGERRTVGIGVEQGASVSLRDYSKYIDNGFGDYVLKQGNYAKDVRMSVPVLDAQVDDVFEYLTTLRATPCLFIGSVRRRLLTSFGFIQDVPTVMTNTAVSEIDFNIKALT